MSPSEGKAVRRTVETRYRGRRIDGEWFVEDGELHIVSSFGTMSQPVGPLAIGASLPSEAAKLLLWQLAREADPHRPFLYWPGVW